MSGNASRIGRHRANEGRATKTAVAVGCTGLSIRHLRGMGRATAGRPVDRASEQVAIEVLRSTITKRRECGWTFDVSGTYLTGLFLS
jgi:hypothetical protein